MITAVIFDWGGVLIDDPQYPMFSYIASQIGVSYEELMNAMRYPFYEYERGKIDEQVFLKLVCKRLNRDTPKKPIWQEALRRCYKEKEGMFKLAEELHKKGYKLAIISNTELPIVELFHEKFKQKKYRVFSEYILSPLAGFAKPDKEIFDMMLAKLKVKPSETLFIDDKEVNVKGGTNAGLKAIHFTGEQNLRESLIKLKVIGNSKL